MKIVQTFVSAVVGGFILTLAVGAHAQSTSKPGYATVVRMQGEARYSAGDNVWHPLVLGQALGPGNVIQTAADAKVDLVLGDRVTGIIAPNTANLTPPPPVPPIGLPMQPVKAQAAQNIIRMEGDTVLAIDKLTIANTGVDAVSDTELDLREGSIFGNVKKLSAASQYLIKMPNGIAGVRGSTFKITIKHTKDAKGVVSSNGDITVVSGSMVVSFNLDGKIVTRVLGPGDQLNTTTGQVTLLSPTQLSNAEATAVWSGTFAVGLSVSYGNNNQTYVFVAPNKNKGQTSSNSVSGPD